MCVHIFIDILYHQKHVSEHLYLEVLDFLLVNTALYTGWTCGVTIKNLSGTAVCIIPQSQLLCSCGGRVTTITPLPVSRALTKMHPDVKCFHVTGAAGPALQNHLKKTPQDEDLQVQDALASAVAPQLCTVSLPCQKTHTSTQQFKSTQIPKETNEQLPIATVSTLSSSRQLPSLAAFAPRQRPVASSVWNSKVPHIPGQVTL